MLNTDDSWLNPSKRAKEYLDKALEGDTAPEGLVVLNKRVLDKEASRKTFSEKKSVLTDFTENDDRTINVGEARQEDPLLVQVSDRQKVRLLLVTKDASILEKGSLAYQRISGVKEMFFELHVIVLSAAGSDGGELVLRPFENVWMYQTNSKHWWKSMYDAYRIAENQLVFSGGFRADIIMADDLFECGLVGWYIARRHNRPFQLHVHEDFFDPSFIEEQRYPALYELSVWHLLRNVKSVRTKTDFQRQAVIQRNPGLEPYTELLPTYYNLNIWRDLPPSIDLHAKYPQFKFIILHVSSMRPSSHSIEALLGASKILKRYPSIGLVMVGNGPLRADLERQVIALGLQNQVEFEPMPPEVISHMKTANVLLYLSDDSEEENLLLEGAVAKIPLVANANGLAGKLFVDGESACLCMPNDIQCISESINRYLNENQERSSFAINASEIVFERIDQDYGVYLEAFRDSVERSMATLG